MSNSFFYQCLRLKDFYIAFIGPCFTLLSYIALHCWFKPPIDLFYDISGTSVVGIHLFYVHAIVFRHFIKQLFDSTAKTVK